MRWTEQAIKRTNSLKKNNMKVLILFLLLHLVPCVVSTIASHLSFQERQPDGAFTPSLYLNGDEHVNFLSDKDGYIVMEDDNNWFVYAEENMTGLVPGVLHVGSLEIENHTLQAKVHWNEYKHKTDLRNLQNNNVSGRQPITKGLLTNLVVLLCFADHIDRDLPSVTEIDTLYNTIGGSSRIAPSGSVRDFFRQGSYGKLDVQSHIYGWVMLPKNESYYAGGKAGDSDIFLESIMYALSFLDQDQKFSFSDFDENGDGYIDAMSFIHSGYGAEWGGGKFHDRIWSHKLSLPARKHWHGTENVIVDSYHTSTAFYGAHGKEIARIGTLSHELGHFIGLPDLYDKSGIGSGVGSFCLMGDSWGFDGSQMYPGSLSIWSKIQLGWVEPTVITEGGIYSLNASQFSDEAFRIDIGFKEGEYLLLENRQNVGFDQHLDHGGIAVWHIDEMSQQSSGGYPGQNGWPNNGNHYKVALIQADGRYDLERGNQRRGAGDLFYKGGVDTIGPSNSYTNGPFPNTDSYQGGIVVRSGISIFNISESQEHMSFQISFNNSSGKSSENDTWRSLETTFESNSGLAGNMFTIVAQKALILHNFHIHIMPLENEPFFIWMKKGSYRGFETDEESWELLLETNITGMGVSKPTKIIPGSFDPIFMLPSESMSFYMTLSTTNGVRYTQGESEGRVFSENLDMKILEGIGVTYPFGRSFSPRIWNGGIKYELVDLTDAPSQMIPMMPSSVPIVPPSTLILPSLSPIPQYPSKILTSTFSGGSGLSGNMMTIVAKSCIAITGLAVNVALESPIIEIWVKEGGYVGYENNKSFWKKHFEGRIDAVGMDKPSPIPIGGFKLIRLAEAETLSLYITVQGPTGMRYTFGTKQGEVFSRNNELLILEGIGIKYPFGDFYSPRVWNGSIMYENVSCNEAPSQAPTVPNINCGARKKWSKWKNKCVPRCRKRYGLRYNHTTKKCTSILSEAG